MPGMKFLKDSVDYGIEKLGFIPDSWVYELVIGCLGDFYPEPDRYITTYRTSCTVVFRGNICVTKTKKSATATIFSQLKEEPEE